MTDSEKLLKLADWLDLPSIKERFPEWSDSTAVQNDLRSMANKLKKPNEVESDNLAHDITDQREATESLGEDEVAENVVIYAWVGEDELGSGKVGLKQALTPSGLIPLVSTDQEKISEKYIVEQMQKQFSTYNKTIRLCRFVFDGVIEEVK